MITIKDVKEANKNINETAYLLRLCRALGNHIVVFLANKSLSPLIINFINKETTLRIQQLKHKFYIIILDSE